MNNCPNLYLLAAIACQLEKLLQEEELEILAADLTVLGDMLTSILAHRNTDIVP